MKIVVTHISPDFDAISSAYGALLAHDCDHIAVCSSYENNVHEFLENHKSQLPIKNYNEQDVNNVDKIELLIITDCKQSKRLGALAPLVKKAEKVIIYDHHPAYGKDIEGAEEIVSEYGSAATILVEKLQEKNLELTKFQATLLAMGIYEDTGMLTFSSTKAEDAKAIAYLISNGADTTAVNDYIKRDLSRVQVFVLNELLLNLSMISVAEQDVAIAYATTEQYVDEMAYVVSRLMSIEGLESLFAVIASGDRLVLIGRSKTPNVDVSAIVSKFGGGGHAVAASAIIKDLTLNEAIDKLKYCIREEIKPVKTVSEIMNSPAKFIHSGKTVADALDLTLKYNLNHMPVVEGNRSIGLISHRIIMDAMKHGLQGSSVNDIMEVEFEIMSPDTSFYEAEEIMVYKGQAILPVENERGLVGVVTRTDLLRLIHEEITLRSNVEESARAKMGLSKYRNIRKMLEDSLPHHIKHILIDIGKLAEKNDYKVYVVGGFVRDILMRNENQDIDIVVEGDAPTFATLFANEFGGKVSVHAKFKTAVVSMKDGFKIDFATARTEYYITPAAMPEVEEASIKKDLLRRDFTINAMAVRLNGSQHGMLIDFFAGQKDINEKKIRVLHSLSLVDDPSRALRAIRFAVRFNFNIGMQTERLIKHAESLNLFGQIQGNRLFLELKYILDEKGYIEALTMMKKYNLLRFYHNELKLDEILTKHEHLEELLAWYTIQFDKPVSLWKTRFILLFRSLVGPQYADMIKMFQLPRKQFEELVHLNKQVNSTLGFFKRYKNPRVSEITAICDKLSVEELLALGATMHGRQNYVKEYLTKYSTVTIELDGNDLLSLGVKKGPDIKDYLNQLHEAKLNSIIETKDDEINYIKSLLNDKDKHK